MSDNLQHFGSIGTLILKILVVLIILRILIFAVGLDIIEYVPVIDDIISLMHKGLFSISKWGEAMLGKIVTM